MTTQQDSARHTIRLADAQIEALLDRLDAESATAPNASETPKLFPYRNKTLRVELQPLGGSFIRHLMIGRGINGNSIALLHGGFVHAQTPCTVNLISQYGSWDIVKGIVVDCRHVIGSVHELHIRFDRPIDAPLYSSAAHQPRILLVEDEPISASIAIHHLTSLNAQLTHVTDGQSAVEEARSGTYDLIVMDIEMPILDGLSATRQLREGGYSGKIAVVTSHTRDTSEEDCLKSGADYYIAKPYTVEDLANVLTNLSDEPLYSSMSHDPGMAPVINAFVESIPTRLQSLQAAIESGDRQKIETAARILKSEGGGCGFDPIAECADQLEQDASGTADASALGALAVELVRACRSARQATALPAT